MNHDPQKPPFETLLLERFIDAFKRLVEVASAALGFVAVAYGVGYLAARSYFSEFHSKWVIDQIAPTSFLAYSLVPLATLAFLVFLGITDLIEGGTRRIRCSLWVLTNGYWFVLGWLILDLLLRTFWHPYAAFSMLGFGISVFYAGAVIEVIAVTLSTGTFGYNRQSAYLIYGVCWLALLIAPDSYGRANALRDLDPEQTTLPVIHLTKQEADSNLHLLFASDGVYYCVELLKDTKNPKVFPIQQSEVAFVVAKAKK